jgi:hypothetical protein
VSYPEFKAKWFVDVLLEGYPDVDYRVLNSFSNEFIQTVPFIPEELLCITMSALSRFLCHVQFFGNQLQSEVSRLKRYFEGQKFLTMSKLTGVTDRTTGNLLMAMAYKANPELNLIEEHLAVAEERAKYYERMPERISEHIQVLKYELKRRENKRG